MAEIRMTLLSDLCAATGKGYAHTVDTDICFDAYGLPFFPARRLKGCLREAACYLLGEDAPVIREIFGETGKRTGGALQISNGQMENREELIREINSYSEKERPTADQILQLFTGIRAQTRIDPQSGTAMQETLRFTRVLNQDYPWKKDKESAPVTFRFPVECDSRYGDTLRDLCKALRHVGANRTRGLGNVKVEYVPDASSPRNRVKLIPQENGTALLPLCIRLDDPAILSDSDGSTRAYVPGSALLGAMAGLYLKEHEADETFMRIFLSGQVRFGNCYLSDGKGNRAVPAPGWLRKFKTAKGEDELADGTLICLDPEKPERTGKPLKGKFVWLSETPAQAVTVEPAIESVYHHTVNADRMLYTQTALSAGQYFQGTVSGSEEQIQILAGLLNKYPLRIGKSKTAQYAGCTVFSPELAVNGPETIQAQAGEILFFELASDVILMDDAGNYTTGIRELMEKLLPGADIQPGSALTYRRVEGFNARRNLANIPCMAYAMGSLIVAAAPQDVSLPATRLIGERTGEGYGEVICRSLKQVSTYDLNPKPAQHKGEMENSPQAVLLTSLISEKQAERAAYERALELLQRHQKEAACMTKSFIGRALLMVQQADDYENLRLRINSIKDQNKQKALNRLYEDVRGDDRWRLALRTVLRLMRYTAGEEEEE